MPPLFRKVLPPSIEYMYGGFPPDATIVKVPSFPPLQLTSVFVSESITIAIGSVKFRVLPFEIHPLLSRTTTL